MLCVRLYTYHSGGSKTTFLKKIVQTYYIMFKNNEQSLPSKITVLSELSSPNKTNTSHNNDDLSHKNNNGWHC